MDCAFCGGISDFDVQKDGVEGPAFALCASCQESMEDILSVFGPHGRRWTFNSAGHDARVAVDAAEDLLRLHRPTGDARGDA